MPMTLEEAAEEVLKGTSEPCGACKSTGAIPNGILPGVCHDCFGAGALFRDEYLEAIEILGIERPPRPTAKAFHDAFIHAYAESDVLATEKFYQESKAWGQTKKS